jgi:virulence factor Mce-like protein
MRRLAAVAAVLCAAALAGATLPWSGARGASDYRVDAIFDTAKGIIPGQLVKVAGARVGKVEDVRLTRDYKARIELTVDRRFAPFRANASCSIQPEGLLAENFVQCDPGTPAARPLRGAGDATPTVPVERNTVPVNLNDLFNIWNVPTRDRLRVLIDELGISVAGRGEDLNAVLRRTNPTLTLARRVIAILSRQRADLAATVTNADRVLAALAPRRRRVADFIAQAARVTARTAAHRGDLAEGIRRLPALLRAADPALLRLDQLVVAGRPLLGDLRVAAPGLNRLVARVEPFARAGTPALRRLGGVMRIARRATRTSKPVIAQSRRFTTRALPIAPVISRLFVNARDRGIVENGLEFFYHAASSAARFDRVSHILPAHFVINECSRYSEEFIAACSARFSSPAAAAAAARRPRASGLLRLAARPPRRTPAARTPSAAPGGGGGAGGPGAHGGLAGQVAAGLGLGDDQDLGALGDLADYLLR